MHVYASGVMPGPVSELKVMGPPTPTAITITWVVSQDIFIKRFEVTYNYTVKRCQAPHVINTNTTTISNGTVRTYTLENLNEDSTYRITVKAINDEGSTMSTVTADTSTSSKVDDVTCLSYYVPIFSQAPAVDQE